VTGARVSQVDGIEAGDGLVDARLDYSDGRRGSLEVTSIGDPSEFQLNTLLGRRRQTYENPGNWHWSITVGRVSELPRLDAIYREVILRLERSGVSHLREIPLDEVLADPDLDWLAHDSETEFQGFPTIPKLKSDGTIRAIGLSGIGVAAAWLGANDPVSAPLEATLSSQNLVRHIDKLLRSEEEERHLFLIVGWTSLTLSAVFELLDPEQLPSIPPSVPEGITHLWLATGFGGGVLRWARGVGWEILPVR